ncbi:hypothetical protein GCM10007094_35510 [Pseudovibrio japonicus]|uniref:Pyridoxamine 5'-phosphate oxidase Alr4036 family FMN-binding domain-containing protein n=1 Tax=Pseudovibrio japonicus TaxID=366534 RepID=A0ABQ3EJT2_9HYPH|nr:pyridoxamine 5'-phosphate oxidase family protein [Pseudovibrio japonicus]GHB43033.1 hypothetical protein GCM10007094_35510 [Pseudovibrio japonicus]
MELSDYDKSCWEQLEKASRDPEAPFRYLTVCSVDQNLQPQARTMVLRAVTVRSRELEFHTDIRSPKWEEFQKNKRATVLGYCPNTRLQLRLQGTITLHAPGTLQAQSAWSKLSHWTKQTYAGGPPGDELAFEPAPVTATSPESTDSSRGEVYFGALIFHATSLDRFQLQRQNNQRILFEYDSSGSLVSGNWVNP